MADNEDKYGIVQHIGTIGKSSKYSIEANLVTNKIGAIVFDLGVYQLSDHVRHGHVMMYPDQVNRLRDLLNEFTEVKTD